MGLIIYGQSGGHGLNLFEVPDNLGSLECK